MKFTNKWKLLFVILLIGFFGGCTKATQTSDLLSKPDKQEIFALGTYVEIKVYDKHKETALADAMSLIKKYDKEITVNEDGSILDEVNENAGIRPVKVPKDIMKMLVYAKSASEDQGSFDITIGALTKLWHIGFSDAKKPSQSEIDQALQLIDYHNLVLDVDNSTAYLTEKGMQIDAGAIAKGFITDQVVTQLEKNGVTCAIVNLGGNVYVIGNSPKADNKDAWTVGIQDPNKARNTVLGYVQGRDESFVTSGIYERYLEVDGKKYHHMLDPKTGYPFDNDLQSVTIIGKSSMTDDAYSTIVYSLGVKEGLKYINDKKGYEAIFVTKENKIYLSKGLEDNFDIETESGYTMGNNSDIE
ncbi:MULTISPECIES: FAD:protein FMN transferase [unclassified Enterococcus]|uniref:FAD:protein FMN transferase n=1 Tax=unclassified Enterococcus TaxID=2608891 RepID=UPI0015573D57|nr:MULTISPECIES: FAD:protein FMN transferase [unclassified Enterococcus]MBS7577886.1 FAD:protein FMN transferase [Enterococcus sp. MMGLQ5-2]MBS7585146.1 FAD:protein FMN transferase [Enterococcus sp. MMGLQ5-1]NPD13002.1 FAD:protein FMN transferase [Enterococcus sp. MMGLQ5-1]NPD37716.1 FAD:protein FMN transferase [Enterococcus sp. MMGLQ5-2]